MTSAASSSTWATSPTPWHRWRPWPPRWCGSLSSIPRNIAIRRDLAGAKYNIAYLRRELGNEGAALAAYDESLAMRLALDREHPDDPRFAFDAATTLGNIGTIHVDSGAAELARDAYARAVGLATRLAAAHPENTTYQSYLARFQTDLALSLINLGDLDGAGRPLGEAAAVTERLTADQPAVVQNWIDVAGVRWNRGILANRRGRIDEAVDWYRRALEAYVQALERRPNDPFSLNMHALATIELAELLNRVGRPAGALEPLARAAEGVSAALARDPGALKLKPILPRVFRARAEALARLGRASEASDAWAPRPWPGPGRGRGWARPCALAAWSGDPSRALAELEGAESRREPTPERLAAQPEPRL